MAYSSTIVVRKQGVHLVVTIAELEAATGSETTAIETGYRYLTLLSQECKLTAGTGTTVNPSFGTKALFVLGDGLVYLNGGAAAEAVHNDTISFRSGAPSLFTTDGKLFHKSSVDAAADNSVSTTYLFKIGW